MRGRWLRRLAVALGALGLAGGSVFAVSLGLPFAAGPRGSAEGLPDLLLRTRYPERPQRASGAVVAVLDARGTFRPLLDGASQPTISPDGRELYFIQEREVRDEVRTAVVAFDAHSLRQLWSADLDSRPAAQPTEPSAPPSRPDSRWVGVAVTRDQVYAARFTWETPEPVTVVGLDRVDGLERRRWTVDLQSRGVNSLSLFAAPDGKRLTLLAWDVGPPGQLDRRPIPRLLRFRLPGGQEEARLPVASADEPGTRDELLIGQGRVGAAGGVLYGVGYAAGGVGVRVTLLDLATGAGERLNLPFRAGSPSQPFGLPFESGLSPDGQRLYVLAPSLGQVAVVDLANRRLEQVVELDTSAVAGAPAPALLGGAWDALALLRGAFLGQAWAKPYLLGALQLSPDGRRLYAIGTAPNRQDTRADGVWVVDTTTWRVVERWLPGAEPMQLLLSGDGRILYLWTDVVPTLAPAGTLRALDATTGAERLSLSETQPAALTTLPELYRQTYGRDPERVAPRAGGAPEVIVTAELAVSVSPAVVVAGAPVQIEARFVDPSTGRTVPPAQTGVRYEPPARVTASLAAGVELRAEAAAVTLDPAGYGVYRASLAPPEPPAWSSGTWAVQVVAEWPDGLKRRAVLADALVVQPAFAGTDGRRYRLAVSSEPAQPRLNQPVALSATIVDVERGTPLPAGIALEGGLPDTVEVTLLGPDRGMRLIPLRSVGWGSYAGEARLWAAGRWRVQARLGPVPDRPASITVGTLDVVR